MIALGLTWVGILAAILLFDAALWLMALFALCTLPALYDIAVARRAGIALDPSGLSWFAGRQTGDITWERISHMRLDTRLDFSVRTSAVLTSGKRIRLPLECTPPADTLEQVLGERGISVQRHHFSLLG